MTLRSEILERLTREGDSTTKQIHDALYRSTHVWGMRRFEVDLALEAMAADGLVERVGRHWRRKLKGSIPLGTVACPQCDTPLSIRYGYGSVECSFCRSLWRISKDLTKGEL